MFITAIRRRDRSEKFCNFSSEAIYTALRRVIFIFIQIFDKSLKERM